MFREMALCAVRNKILRQSIISPVRHICLFCNEPHKTPYTFQISLFRKLSNAVPVSIQREEELELPEDIKRKIIFNSLTHKFGFLTRKKIERREKLHKKRMEAAMAYTPVSLKYLNNDESFEYPSSDAGDDSPNDNKESDSYILNLPYKKSVKDNIFINKNNSEVGNDDYDIINDNSKVVNENVDYQDLISDYPSKYIGKWMNDYEKYSEEESEGTELSFWRDDYGTPDSSVPVSRVPCGGCGAHLHCQDHSIPGYLPSEIFKNCDEKDLREIVCQRCHFLKNYNTALSVTVNPEDYPQIISKIRDKKALVVLIADMTDLPCSIWPGILEIIGPRQPLFLVGNKVDLLPGDRKGWLREAQSYLRSCFPKNAVVHFTSLISAKTGFGVEELINKMHNFWQYKGDVYLVGCTNVGKSTLFNALLQSDYCKVKAVDLLQRATTAPWPGTTLNLLKFPILRPDGWRLYMRTQRLIQNRKSLAAERKLKNQQKVLNKTEFPQLIGHIGRTFSRKKPEEEFKSIDNFSTGKPERLGLDPNDPDFAKSKWVFDTPGVLTKEQCLDLLTTDEVYLTVPKEVIVPRTFIMKVGWSLFVAGLARIDYLSGEQDIKVTIFSANTLPVTILHQEHAEEIYKELLGSEALQVPQGPEERLKAWPGLERAKEINLIGVDGEESCADVSLSSAGWASITPYEKEIVKLSFWTPEGRGVHVRAPLLPKAVSLRGKKLNKIPVYGRTRPSLAGYKEY